MHAYILISNKMQKLLKMFKMINMKTNKKFIILPALFLTSFAPLFAMSCDKMQNDNSKNIIKEEVDFVPFWDDKYFKWFFKCK